MFVLSVSQEIKVFEVLSSLHTERVSHRCVLSGASLVPLIHENALGKAGIQSFSDLYECVCVAQDGLIF